jgi:hypothetical protein
MLGCRHTPAFNDSCDLPLSLRLCPALHSLWVRRVWWSSKSTRMPVTVYATATLDRLEMLEAQ